jgi:predicted nuclease of predicted toxin-antitoxin system
MRLLLDENVPVQAVEVLRRTLRGHEVDHVEGIRWKGKKDLNLLPDAAAAGYAAFVTKDANQLNDPKETQLIRKSKLHHIRFGQDDGVAGFARAVGALVAAMPEVVEELATVRGPRLVNITKLDRRKRHTTIDPKTDPPPYWRRRR